MWWRAAKDSTAVLTARQLETRPNAALARIEPAAEQRGSVSDACQAHQVAGVTSGIHITSAEVTCSDIAGVSRSFSSRECAQLPP